MVLKLNKHLYEQDLLQIYKSDDPEIILDMEEVLYLSIKELGNLVRLKRQGRAITLLNANNQIKGAIEILQIKNEMNVV